MSAEEWAIRRQRHHQWEAAKESRGEFGVPIGMLLNAYRDAPDWYEEDLDHAYEEGVLDAIDAVEDWILDLNRGGYSRIKEIVWLIERHRLRRVFDNVRRRRQYIPPLKWPTWSEMRERVIQRDGGKCVSCGGGGKLEVDHVCPVADGGVAEESNLQTLCTRCHDEKSKTVYRNRKPRKLFTPAKED